MNVLTRRSPAIKPVFQPKKAGLLMICVFLFSVMVLRSEPFDQVAQLFDVTSQILNPPLPTLNPFVKSVEVLRQISVIIRR